MKNMTDISSSKQYVSVSVIIATYGRQALLDETLRSLANQTHMPDEVIIVDDCSPSPITVCPTLSLNPDPPVSWRVWAWHGAR